MSGPLALALGLPADASTQGWRIDGILHGAHWAAGGLALLVGLWLLVILVRDRRSGRSRFTHGTSARERAVPLAMAAFMLLAVDGYLLRRSHLDVRDHLLAVDDVIAHQAHLRVQIGARQWAWEFRYAGADERFGTEDDFYSTNTLVVPLGLPVVYQLSALDLVHSFYLPNFRVKQDAIPGRVVRGWFAAKKTGQFEIACAQYCGTNHFQMAGVVEVLPAGAFADWSAEMSADALRMHAEVERAKREEAGVSELSGDLVPRFTWAWSAEEGP